jgi:hypothetical protein
LAEPATLAFGLGRGVALCIARRSHGLRANDGNDMDALEGVRVSACNV